MKLGQRVRLKNGGAAGSIVREIRYPGNVMFYTVHIDGTNDFHDVYSRDLEPLRSIELSQDEIVLAVEVLRTGQATGVWGRATDKQIDELVERINCS